jgi:hypothetical protein
MTVEELGIFVPRDGGFAMARDPDSLESTETEQGATTTAAQPGAEFTAGPSRAERAMPRSRRTLPIWPWLVIVAVAIVIALVVANT